MYKLSLFLHNKMSSQVAPSHGPPDLRIQDILISKTTIKKKSHKRIHPSLCFPFLRTPNSQTKWERI